MSRLSAVFFCALSAFGLTAHAADAAKKPQLSVTTLSDGNFDLVKQGGNWVIVNFWATWCSPCLKEIPDISSFVAAHKNVKAIGLAYEEIELDDLKKFLKDHPAGYPIALVDVYSPPKDFDTPRGLPTTYLIAPDGTLSKRFLGPITAQDLETAIAAPVAPGH